MIARMATCLVLIAALTCPASLPAQRDSVSLFTGQRVRVTAPSFGLRERAVVLARVTRETKAVVHGLIGAPLGAIAGGIVGALVRTERWAVVPREQFRVVVVPRRGAGGATGVGFAISF